MKIYKKKDNKKRKRLIHKRRKIQVKPIFPFKSQLEKYIYKKIQHQFPELKIYINEKGLIKSNKKFELDLYFPKYKIGIEIQGPFHTKNINVILKDYRKKIQFLWERNIRIIYIYTNTNENKKYGIKKCIKVLNREKEKHLIKE